MADALADRLPAALTRDELEQMIVERAVNDGWFWRKLANPATTREALAEFFGKPVPPEIEVEVRVENERTFYQVVPAPEATVVRAGPPTLEPRAHFERRINYLVHTDPEFKAEFLARPEAAVAEAFNFRFPEHVEIQPLHEETTVSGEGLRYKLFLVLPHVPHDALFNKPYAVQFDGAGSKVEVSHSSSLEIRDALAVEAWFRARSFDPEPRQGAVVSMRGEGSGWELGVGDAIPRFVATIDGVEQVAQPHEPKPFLEPGAWYHVVGCFDGRELQLFLNGELRATTAAPGAITPSPGPLLLGRSSHAPAEHHSFAGEIDEVRVWSRARSLEEARAYRPRKARGPAVDVRDPELRAYYPMDEGNGTVVHDRSGNGNDGTMVEATWATIGPDAP